MIAECPFFEGNPMGNDELSIATVKAEINGGSFRIIGNGIESFHAEDLTEFVKGGEFIHEFTYKKYLDPETNEIHYVHFSTAKEKGYVPFAKSQKNNE